MAVETVQSYFVIVS